ncbi:MAG: YbjN domain-containing protein [Pseudomonadota bacterium]
MRKTFIAAATAAAMLFTTGAAAQSVDAAFPTSLVDALQEMGYRAKLETDSAGDPKIRSTADGSNYIIYFYGCQDNINCTGVNFSVGFDLAAGSTFEKMNEWNRTKLVGTAFLDNEGDPRLNYFVVLRNGISRNTFERVVARWEFALNEYKAHVGF